MTVDKLIGIFALGFGIVTLVLRFVKPQVLGKLEPMKQKFGNGLGTAIHVFFYTLVPIIAGIIFLSR